MARNFYLRVGNTWRYLGFKERDSTQEVGKIGVITKELIL